MATSGGKVLGTALAAAAAGALAAVFKRTIERVAAEKPGPGPALALEPSTGKLNQALFRVATELLPAQDSVLEPPSVTWDAILGGRKPDYLGGKSWRYYSQFVGENPDGTKRKGGTTCGVFAAACAAKAGWPVELINRATDDAWAPGSGFVPGAHIYKLLGAAEKRGWVHKFSPSGGVAGAALGDRGEPHAGGFQLLPGDYYYQDRKGAMYDGKPVDGGHVGIILAAGPMDARGAITVTTADGGFTNKNGDQCAVRHTRTFYPADGRIVLQPFGIEAKLVSVVRPV